MGVLPNGADAKGWLARPPVRIMTRVLTGASPPPCTRSTQGSTASERDRLTERRSPAGTGAESVSHVHPGQGSEPTLDRKSAMTIGSTGFLAVCISSGVCHPDQNTMASIPAASCTIPSWRATLSG